MRSIVIGLSLVLALVPSANSEDEGKKKPNPALEEVPLPALCGWQGFLLYEGDAGIWTVGCDQILPRYGCPEVWALDDRGRCTILISYSGKWTPFFTVQDNMWLGALQHFDLDPRRAGPEIYTGGKNGHLYQIIAHDLGGFDTALITRFADDEIHTLVGGDLLPSRPGNELLSFSGKGSVYCVMPLEKPGAGFTAPLIDRLEGRVRQALLLPKTSPKHAPWIAAVCRTGELLFLRMTDEGLEKRTILREPMGLGRIAMRPVSTYDSTALYVTRDDGVILRLEASVGSDVWEREIIYAGPQGPRGVITGRFHEDPDVESVAVFGYSGKVQMITREGDTWEAETIFEDVDKGHWLEAVEIDGRNGTDEIIGSGYGKRVFGLARPPGFGLAGAATEPAQKTRKP